MHQGISISPTLFRDTILEEVSSFKLKEIDEENGDLEAVVILEAVTLIYAVGELELNY